ncbi:MAG: hypothetical protein J5J06_10310 [Phycisphaerae bacterium]|nr:hypothetical protein [Phycisphaerae bacterium]
MANESPPARGTDSASSTSAPDWNIVPFDVGCARCGHDLRGLSEPICPACGLTFDWAEAVPIERLTCARCGYHLYGLEDPRCPECGTAFTWEEALLDCRRRAKPLFEYWWRERPIRSAAATLWWSMRPWHLWKRMDLHDPPRVGPLLGLCAFAALAFFITPYVACVLGRIAMPVMLGAGFSYHGFGLGPWGEHFLDGPWLYWPILVGAYLTWMFGILLATSILAISMRRYRMKQSHVLRICTYLALPVSIVPAAFCAMLFPLDLMLAAMFSGWVNGEAIWSALLAVAVGSVLIVPIVFAFRSIGLAYRHYARMPHAWGLALASQAISALTVANFVLIIYVLCIHV